MPFLSGSVIALYAWLVTVLCVVAWITSIPLENVTKVGIMFSENKRLNLLPATLF